MVLRSIMILALALAVSGCLTTRRDDTLDDLHVRLIDMEQQVKAKDKELRGLKEDIRDVSKELRMTQVKIEEAQTPPPAVTAPVTNVKESPTEPPLIKVSASLKDVQSCLKNAGFYTGAIDGKAGERTKKAIKAFQDAKGLNADGVVGAKTWLKLKSYLY